MLIELHAVPGDRNPVELAKAALAAGLEAVVVTDTERTDRLDDYLDALEDAGVAAFAGIELRLERGRLVLIPRELDDAFYDVRWSKGSPWTLAEAQAQAKALDAILIAAHPYNRDLPGYMGDRIYTLKGVLGLEVRVGQGRPGWDLLAEEAAERLSAVRIGSCGGDISALGRAATVVDADIEEQPDLVAALEAGKTWPVEFEDPNSPRPIERPRRDEGAREERPRRDDDRPREDRPRRDDDRPRGPRREGGRDDRPRGPRRDDDRPRGPRRDDDRPRGPRREGGDRGPRREGGDRGPRRSHDD